MNDDDDIREVNNDVSDGSDNSFNDDDTPLANSLQWGLFEKNVEVVP